VRPLLPPRPEGRGFSRFLVTSRWGVLILVALQGGTHRFSELRRKIGGVSEKMLAQTLTDWIEHNLSNILTARRQQAEAAP
jgi:DNA-binding HxlR family transcriptional regulator